MSRTLMWNQSRPVVAKSFARHLTAGTRNPICRCSTQPLPFWAWMKKKSPRRRNSRTGSPGDNDAVLSAECVGVRRSDVWFSKTIPRFDRVTIPIEGARLKRKMPSESADIVWCHPALRIRKNPGNVTDATASHRLPTASRVHQFAGNQVEASSNHVNSSASTEGRFARKREIVSCIAVEGIKPCRLFPGENRPACATAAPVCQAKIEQSS